MMAKQNIEVGSAIGEPARYTGSHLTILPYLLLCLAGIHFFALEAELQLFTLFAVAVGGFCIHPFLPVRWRLPFTFAVNVIALPILFGVAAGVAVLVVALALYVVVNLPTSTANRAVLCVLIGVVLALAKVSFFPFPALGLVATVVGGLFMFRSLVFLYEVHHTPALGDYWQRLNYFFLLPNLIFVIFPVVDLKVFVRTQQDTPSQEVYRKGVWWIMRGMFHLLLYRLIYYYLVPAPEDIDSLWGVIQYMVTAYLMIIRISGTFHLATGILCLYGFNLPPTFDNYFLATGFSDLWRRINLYWRDFMMTVFYYPIYFRFKQRDTTAMVVSILIVFFINWILHQYQWFWVKGQFPLRLVDVIFWGVFGSLVAVNSVYQAKRKRKKKKGNDFSINAAATTSLKVVGMFSFMCVLWSFWISPGIGPWTSFLKQAGTVTLREVGILMAVLTLLCALGVVVSYVNDLMERREVVPGPDQRVNLYTIGWLIAVVLALPPSVDRLQLMTGRDLAPVLETRLNEADEQRMFNGYYENLLEGQDRTSLGAKLPPSQARWKRLQDIDVMDPAGSPLTRRLKPGVKTVFKGEVFSTNSFGLRDIFYPEEKPVGNLRFALLGGSPEMGAGVADGETFEHLVENRLNDSIAPSDASRIEILNFAVSGIRMPQQIAKLKEAMTFDPDIVMYAVHPKETQRALKTFTEFMLKEELSVYPELVAVGREAKLETDMSPREQMAILEPFAARLTHWLAKRMAKDIKDAGATPVLLFIPVLGNGFRNAQLSDEETKIIFQDAGFLLVDLSEAYDGNNITELRTADDDHHPNASAHRLLAKALLRALRSQEVAPVLFGDRPGKRTGNERSPGD